MSPVIVALVIIGVLIIAVVVSYNRFVGQRQLIHNSWSNVDSELQRRHDLIPNLVETVRGYAQHEAATFERVIAARNRAVSTRGGVLEQTPTQQAVVDGLRQLLALSEAYPTLQASLHFHQLHQELVTTENRIQAARRLYNGNVRGFNNRVQSFPSNLVAKLGRFTPASYFEIDPVLRAAPAPSVGFSPR